jgi:hypothetical protein
VERSNTIIIRHPYVCTAFYKQRHKGLYVLDFRELSDMYSRSIRLWCRFASSNAKDQWRLSLCLFPHIRVSTTA